MTRRESVLTIPQGCVWSIRQATSDTVSFSDACGFGTLFLFFTEVVAISAAGSKDLLINEAIHVKEVRLIGTEGEQVGIMPLAEAQEFAYQHGVDLVLISPTATPPVCRAMDYGKFRFEKEKRDKEAKKKQQVVRVKEVQLSCRIDTHDFNTRVNQAIKFLRGGDKVKVVIRFKGREMAHQDIGLQVITDFLTACAEAGSADKKPTLDGRFMSVMILPLKAGK